MLGIIDNSQIAYLSLHQNTYSNCAISLSWKNELEIDIQSLSVSFILGHHYFTC
jgi:hypothetical protein